MKGLSRKKNTNSNFISKILEEVKSGWDEDADERGVS